jgi:hypothetical protein
MLRNVILRIVRYSELTNFELSMFSCTPQQLQYAFISWLKLIYKSNFIHNTLIKTINSATFKQFVDTTVPVHVSLLMATH